MRKKYKDKTTGPTVKLICSIQKYVFMQEKLVIEDKHPRIKIIIDLMRLSTDNNNEYPNNHHSSGLS